ncbi:hypothetical protein BH11GEM1_BH11GEM1_22550 [soil metagenome]
MVHLSQYWLPILLSAVGVFLASSVIHMALPWHKSDYPKMPNEQAVMDAMLPLAIPPGDYFFPRPGSMADMKSQEYIDRTNRGPVILMTVMPNGIMPMGAIFVRWFIYLLVVSTLVAIVAATSLPAGSPATFVFHETALVSFAAYGLALWQLSIWYRRSLSITIKSTVDAAVYALVTGGIFAWCWPR